VFFMIELFLIFSMTSLNHTILCRFARVNKIMNNIVLCTETIQRMKRLYRHITAFIRTKVVVCEGGVIVSLDGLYCVWEPLHNLSKKSCRTVCCLFIINRQMPPPACCVYGGMLVISPICNLSRNIFNINLNKFSRHTLCSKIFVLHLFCAILPYETF